MVADLVHDRRRVELNHLQWTTESYDVESSKRYTSAVNSTFELGVEEVRRYRWPGVDGARFGRVQHFFFVRTTFGPKRAILLASVRLFGDAGTDDLTGLPLVDTQSTSAHVILARHLNHRVVLPVVGATPSLLNRISRLEADVSKADKHMGLVQRFSSVTKHMAAGDAARLELARLKEELRVVTSSRLLVLGSKDSDLELDVPVIV